MKSRRKNEVGKILFFSHPGQVKRFAKIAKELFNRNGIESTLWTLGEEGYKEGKKTFGFAEIFDLIEDFNLKRTYFKKEYYDHLTNLRLLEDKLGFFFYHKDCASDRYLVGKPDESVDTTLTPGRWNPGQIAALAFHLYKKMQNLIKRNNFIVAVGETNSMPYKLAYHLLKCKKIPYLTPVSTRHWKNRMYFEDDLGYQWGKCRLFYQEYRSGKIPPELLNKAREKLNDIRKKKQHPGYLYKHRRGPERMLKRILPLRLHSHLKEWLRVTKYNSQKNPRNLGPDHISPIGRVCRMVREKKRYCYYEKLVNKAKYLPDRYACYFLHMQPEYTVEDLAFVWQDQIATIRNIISCLPADLPLLVKEHKPSAGRRARHFYAELVSIPNVSLLSDTIDSYDLIENAELIFTLTGTPALEAIYYGKPAIIFGSIFFGEFEGIYKVRSILELEKLLEGGVDKLKGASEKAALSTLAAIYSASYSVNYPGDLERGGDIGRVVDALEKELKGRGITLEEYKV